MFVYFLFYSIQVRSFGGEKRQMSMFGSQVRYWLLRRIPLVLLLQKRGMLTLPCTYSNHFHGASQVLAFQRSGIRLGTFKSVNESMTRVAVYISLLTLYFLGGSKVKSVSCGL